MYNNIITKFIASFLIILFASSPCFAANWVTITAENGKSADLDLDSVKMALDTVEYDIRTEKDGFVYINRFSTELYEEGTPTAIIFTTKYKDDEKISTQDYQERVYRALKDGTLQSEIFDVLSKNLSMREFNKGQNTWDSYLKKQRKLIQRKWQPDRFKYLNKNKIDTTTFITPVYISTVNLKIDKSGRVVSKNTDDYKLNEVAIIDPLPDDYTAKTFDLAVNINYYKYVGAKTKTKKPLVEQITPTKAMVKISKNSRPPVIGHIEYGLLVAQKSLIKLANADLLKNVPLLLILPMIPVQLVTWIGAGVGILVIDIFFLITGGDYNDL